MKWIIIIATAIALLAFADWADSGTTPSEPFDLFPASGEEYEPNILHSWAIHNGVYFKTRIDAYTCEGVTIWRSRSIRKWDE